MKNLLTTLPVLILLSPIAHASQCPDLSGTYSCTSGKTTYTRYIEYDQYDGNEGYVMVDYYRGSKPFTEVLVPDGVSRSRNTRSVYKGKVTRYAIATTASCSNGSLLITTSSNGSDKTTAVTQSQISLFGTDGIAILASTSENGGETQPADANCTRK